MPLSNLTAYTAILENSAATPGLFDRRFQTADANIRAVDTMLSVVSSTISGGVFKSYTNASARDAAIPSPAPDQVIAQKDTGYFYRRDQATGKYVPEGLTRAAGAVVTSNAKAIVGDGVNDDAVQMALADAAAVASGGRHELDLSALPTRCYINSDLTLSAPFRPHSGAARIYVGAGKTLTIAGPFDPGLYGVFDPAMPGSLVFTSTTIHEFRAQWFGVVGNNVVDDAPALNFMTNSLPERATVRFSRGMHLRLGSMWYIMPRAGLWFVSGLDPSDADLNHPAVVVTWAGPSGGYMVGCYNSGYCHFVGFQWDLQTAARGIDVDMFKVSTAAGSATISIDAQLGVVGAGPAFLTSIGPAGTTVSFRLQGGGVANAPLSGTLTVVDGTHATMSVTASVSNVNSLGLSLGPNAPAPTFRISTQCFFKHNQFLFSAANQIGIAASATSHANCEYMDLQQNQFAGSLQAQTFNGNGFGTSAPTGSISAGSNQLTGFTSNPFTVAHNGLAILIAGAGATGQGARGGNASLSGYAKYVSAQRLDIYQDAGLTTPLNATNNSGAAPHFQLGGCYGTGFYNGPSQNAKGHRLFKNDFTNVHIGVDCEGGSIHQMFSNFSNGDINIVMGVAQSEPSSEYGTNSEQARQHLFFGSPELYKMVNGRLAMAAVFPSDGFIKFVAGQAAPIHAENTQFENPMPGNSAVYMGYGQALAIISDNNNYANATSLAELGWDDTSLGSGGGGGVVDSHADLTPNSGFLLYGNTQGGGDRVFGSANLRANGNPRSYRQGLHFFSNPYAPVQADHITSPSVAFYTQSNGGTGGSERLFASLLDSDGITFHTNLALEQGGAIQVADGANIQLDPRVARGFFLTTAQAAPNFLALPAGHWWYELQEFYLILQNGTAGVIAPTWGGGSTGFTGSWLVPTAGFPYPAPGKIRTYRFEMHNGFPYATTWSPADVG